jgi:hypothetical protein
MYSPILEDDEDEDDNDQQVTRAVIEAEGLMHALEVVLSLVIYPIIDMMATGAKHKAGAYFMVHGGSIGHGRRHSCDL